MFFLHVSCWVASGTTSHRVPLWPVSLSCLATVVESGCCLQKSPAEYQQHFFFSPDFKLRTLTFFLEF